LRPSVDVKAEVHTWIERMENNGGSKEAKQAKDAVDGWNPE